MTVLTFFLPSNYFDKIFKPRILIQPKHTHHTVSNEVLNNIIIDVCDITIGDL